MDKLNQHILLSDAERKLVRGPVHGSLRCSPSWKGSLMLSVYTWDDGGDSSQLKSNNKNELGSSAPNGIVVFVVVFWFLFFPTLA